MCVLDLTCLASTVSKILKGYGTLNVNHVTQVTPLLGINLTFLVSVDLVNNCTKFEACSFSYCEDAAKSPKT